MLSMAVKFRRNFFARSVKELDDYILLEKLALFSFVQKHLTESASALSQNVHWKAFPYQRIGEISSWLPGLQNCKASHFLPP